MKILNFSEFLLEEVSNFNNQGKSPGKIMEIQQKLVDLGFLSPTLPGGKDSVDGMFGEVSKDALKRYQSSKALSTENGDITDESLISLGIQPEEEIKIKTLPSGPVTPSQPLGGYGKFTPSPDKSDPLVVVFGGIPVGGRESGDYMYDFFDTGTKNYNLFVAKNHKINGPEAYQALLNKIAEDGITPSKKILYLFSGGVTPGMYTIQKFGADQFDKIYLVDIWMGQDVLSKFFMDLAKNNKEKVEYFYTDYGANNPTAKSSIASSASNSKKNPENNHMKTNVDAIDSLKKYA